MNSHVSSEYLFHVFRQSARSMNATDVAYLLIKCANKSNTHERSKHALRIQSARRWALIELANRLLDHPNDSVNETVETFMGELLCIMLRLQHHNHSTHMPHLFKEALDELSQVEKYVSNEESLLYTSTNRR